MSENLIGLIKPPEPIKAFDGDASVTHHASIASDFFNNPNISEKIKKDMLDRHQARNSLMKFTTYTKQNYKVNWHHEIIFNELDDFLRSPTRNRLMLFVGPRRGKSEIVSRRLAAYALGLNPDLHVISASYGADLAKTMSRDVQRIIDSDSYRKLFPATQLSSANVKSTSKGKYIRTSDKFEIVDHTGGYRAAGVGGAITGAGGDLCFEKSTKVLSSQGYCYISKLKVGDKVWSYNHESGKPEIARVEAIRSRRVSDMVKVTTTGGRKMLCTPDHPFWTKERGYRQAQDLRCDTLISVSRSLFTFKKSDYCFTLRLLWGSVRASKVRVRKSTKEWGKKALLRAVMRASAAQQEPEAFSSKMQSVWGYCREESKTFREKARVLCGALCGWKINSRTKTVSDILSVVWKKASAAFKLYKVLLNEMQERASSHSNAREEKPKLQGRHSKYLSDVILFCARVYLKARQKNLCNLFNTEKASRPPYQRRQEGHVSRESGNPVPQLPRYSPQIESDTVSSVEADRSREVEVYDIQVARNHNFFAEGILVHNCIIDDPVKDWKEALSSVSKQNVYDWYTSTFYTRLSKNGKVIILMTRWSDDDLCGRLLKEAASDPGIDQWEVISFPEIFDSENEYNHPLDPREDGEVLWPEQFSEQRVNAIKLTVGTKVWTSLYQQQPKPGDGTVFKTQWFKYFDEPPNFDRVVISWDFNFGNDTKDSDYVAGTVWGLKGSNKYLIYLTRERLSFTAALAEVIRVHHLFPKANYTVIEGKANGPAITDVVKDKIPGVVVYMPTTSKENRATAVSPQFEAGNIFLPNMYHPANRGRYVWAIKLLKDYIEEFKAFPYVDNDDMVDSTVQMLLREFDTPVWLASAEVSKEDDKPKIQTERERIIAEVFGWGDKLGTSYDPAEDAPRIKLGF